MVVAGTAEQSSMAAAQRYMAVALRRELVQRTCLRRRPVFLTTGNGARVPGVWLLSPILVSRSRSAECVLRGDVRRLG
jgi:hypothetical protein